MKKVFLLLLLVCSQILVNSCGNDSTASAPSTDVTYDEIKNLPNSLKFTVTQDGYQWIMNPTTYTAQMAANGLSIVGERFAEEGTTTFAMMVPLRKGSGLSSLTSLTVNKMGSYKTYHFKSSMMKTNYNLQFYSDSLVYGSFYATAQDESGNIVTISDGAFKMKVKK